MIDTHAHLLPSSYQSDFDQRVKVATEALRAIIVIGTDFTTSKEAIDLASENQNIFAVVGFHPECVVKPDFDPTFVEQALGELLRSSTKIVAIGEIGLDYHYDNMRSQVAKEMQIDLFRRQLDFARYHKLPVVIHSRDAFVDTLSVVDAVFAQNMIRGVWHSFAESIDALEQVLARGFRVGINGIVTFPLATKLQIVVEKIPPSKLLLETDAPYLAPQPHRGQINSPELVYETAQLVAKLQHKTLKQLEKITDENAIQLFGLTHV